MFDGRRYESGLSLMHAGASDAELERLAELERCSGFRTGPRFSLEGRDEYEVVVDWGSGEFFIGKPDEPRVPLTREHFAATSGLCYWPRS